MGLSPAASSAMDVELGTGQVGAGLIESLAGRVGAGDPTEQALQGLGSAQALQIADQGKGAIGLAPPTEAEIIGETNLQVDRLGLIETLDLSASLGLDAEACQAGGQAVGVAQHRGQDGEMGHGSDARFF